MCQAIGRVENSLTRVITVSERCGTRQRKMRFQLTLALILAVVCAMLTMPAEGKLVHVPGKTCKDAPPCPGGKPCVMAPPRCNVGTCGKDPVPMCDIES